jgi:hypothetical protein
MRSKPLRRKLIHLEIERAPGRNVAVFDLTHYPHPPAEMAVATTFHFVTDGIRSTYIQANARREAPLSLDSPA